MKTIKSKSKPIKYLVCDCCKNKTFGVEELGRFLGKSICLQCWKKYDEYMEAIITKAQKLWVKRNC